MICNYSSVTFDIVFISKAVLCLVPVAVSKWFLHTPFLLWILGNATSLLWDVTQPLACVIEETVLGELNRGLKRRRVHADPVSTLSSSLLIFHPVNTLPVLFPDTSPFFFVAILVIEPTLQETQRKIFSFFFNSVGILPFGYWSRRSGGHQGRCWWGRDFLLFRAVLPQWCNCIVVAQKYLFIC